MSHQLPLTQPKHLPNPAALWVLAFIMLINALAYGTIIPLLYPYAERFGINAAGLSILFASFSLAQFLATPILGRLSDRYGRKPILLICLFGTSLSLALFASATNVVVLFLARIIDGITGGNISVAQAMIADSTQGNDRAKSFAMLGAAFGVGFLVGPTLGGVLSQYGIATPFWFSSFLALVATLLGIIILKETLPAHRRQTNHKPLFNFVHIAKALFAHLTGLILLIGFIASIAQNALVIGMQSYTNDVLLATPFQIGLMFGAIGLVTILTQAVGIRILLAKVPNKKRLVMISFLLAGIMALSLVIRVPMLIFVIELLAYSVLLSPVLPVITGLLSERVKNEDQGGILGINQSYTSLGQIIGPLMAGAVATQISIPAVFILAGGFLFLGFAATAWLKPIPKQKFDL